jgi:hypothetical protein
MVFKLERLSSAGNVISTVSPANIWLEVRNESLPLCYSLTFALRVNEMIKIEDGLHPKEVGN